MCGDVQGGCVPSVCGYAFVSKQTRCMSAVVAYLEGNATDIWYIRLIRRIHIFSFAVLACLHAYRVFDLKTPHVCEFPGKLVCINKCLFT